jgi:hypothetical protein
MSQEAPNTLRLFGSVVNFGGFLHVANTPFEARISRSTVDDHFRGELTLLGYLTVRELSAEKDPQYIADELTRSACDFALGMSRWIRRAEAQQIEDYFNRPT